MIDNWYYDKTVAILSTKTLTHFLHKLWCAHYVQSDEETTIAESYSNFSLTKLLLTKSNKNSMLGRYDITVSRWLAWRIELNALCTKFNGKKIYAWMLIMALM